LYKDNAFQMAARPEEKLPPYAFTLFTQYFHFYAVIPLIQSGKLKTNKKFIFNWNSTYNEFR